MTNSCKSDITGLPLKAFTEISAIQEISNAWGARKKALMRYHCSHCKFWHVIDEDIQKIINTEICKKCFSSSRKLKLTHNNSEEAKLAGIRLTKNLGIFHRIYPCPYGFGWHVTSEQQKNYEYKVELIDELIIKQKNLPEKKIGATSSKNTELVHKKEWTKTSTGLKNNKTGLFVSFSITLRDLVPIPGYTVNSHIVKFIKDSDIENP